MGNILVGAVKGAAKWAGLPALGIGGSILEDQPEAISKSTAGAKTGFNFLTLRETGAARAAYKAAKAAAPLGRVGLKATGKIVLERAPLIGLAFAAKDIYDMQKEGREAYAAGKEADRTAAYNQKNYGTVEQATKTRRSRVREKLTGVK